MWWDAVGDGHSKWHISQSLGCAKSHRRAVQELDPACIATASGSRASQLQLVGLQAYLLLGALRLQLCLRQPAKFPTFEPAFELKPAVLLRESLHQLVFLLACATTCTGFNATPRMAHEREARLKAMDRAGCDRWTARFEQWALRAGAGACMRALLSHHLLCLS